MNIRVMTIEDFDQVHALWMSIKGLDENTWFWNSKCG